jgi:hypothetical protein
MRWLGQAQRAFDLMCERANSPSRLRRAAREEAAQSRAMVFDTAAEIQACSC